MRQRGGGGVCRRRVVVVGERGASSIIIMITLRSSRSRSCEITGNWWLETTSLRVCVFGESRSSTRNGSHGDDNDNDDGVSVCT